MPRLNYKKTKSGCQRCKTRKVKCDEARPKCFNCSRHNVTCEYKLSVQPRKGRPPRTPLPPAESVDRDSGKDNDDLQLDHGLELHLMHHWMAYASKTISAAHDYWMYKAPLIAMQYRYALDSMLALAALHATRQAPQHWVPTEGRMVPILHSISRTGDANVEPAYSWKLRDWMRRGLKTDMEEKTVEYLTENGAVAGKKSAEMLLASRTYFDRAIDGHQKALAALTESNIEAVFITSVMVSFIALVTLGEDGYDPQRWLRIGGGITLICHRWHELIGDKYVAKLGILYGKPDLSDLEELFHPRHAETFASLLTLAEEYEKATPEDKRTYQKATSYIGLMYKGIVEGTDHHLVTLRRVTAIPAVLSGRFVELVEMEQPRALVILAHVFAMMKLIDHNVPWFRGIAEHQIPSIHKSLPAGWRTLMEWPLAVTNDLDSKAPMETNVAEGIQGW